MPTSDEVEHSVEQTVLKLRGFGAPTTRENWKTVFAMLLPCTEEALEFFVRHGRMLGVQWIVRVAEGILTEVAAGRAFRDQTGALRLREKPQAEVFRELE